MIPPNHTPPFNTDHHDRLTTFLLFIVIAGVLITGTMAGMYAVERRNEFTRLETAELYTLILHKELITQYFNILTSDVLFLARQNELREYLADGQPSRREAMAREYMQFCRRKEVYDQILYLNENGAEVVKVNYQNGSPTDASGSEPDTQGAGYFPEAMALDHDQVFVSPMNIAVENGRIEYPFKPMIRFATPVFDAEGRKRGILMLNYLGDRLITLIDQISRISTGDIMLVNTGGYLITGPDPASLWGFAIPGRSDRRFQILYPGTWPTISTNPKGRLYSQDGLFIFNTVNPLLGKAWEDTHTAEAANLYEWKIVAHIPREELNRRSAAMQSNYFIFGAVLFLTVIGPSWMGSGALVRRRRDRQRLEQMAHHDWLTGLPNRGLFKDRLDQAIRISRRYKRRFALLFLDLDSFKTINDTLGHDTGDRVLKIIGRRLQTCVRESDTVARIGGDEFVIILSSIGEPSDASLVAEKIRENVARPIDLGGNTRIITASIGISIYPDHGEDLLLLMQRADASMYQAKLGGKNSYRFFMENTG